MLCTGGLCGRQGDAEQATLNCVEACRIDEVFSDSKFLRAESLLEFVKAIIWAAGLIPGGQKAQSPALEDTDTAELCLELLIGVTIRNRDRIELLWPLVHAHLEAVIARATHPASPLVERAVLGLLRVCQRLLPYKEEIADELLRSLHLIFKLDPTVAEELAVVITGEVLGLVKTSAAYIQSEWGWKTVCTLLKAASHHSAARGMAFEALGVITQEGHLTVDNFRPCLETAMDFIDNVNQQGAAQEATQVGPPGATSLRPPSPGCASIRRYRAACRAPCRPLCCFPCQVLNLFEAMNSWLVSGAEQARDAADKDTYSSMWLSLIQSLAKVPPRPPAPPLLAQVGAVSLRQARVLPRGSMLTCRDACAAGLQGGRPGGAQPLGRAAAPGRQPRAA